MSILSVEHEINAIWVHYFYCCCLFKAISFSSTMPKSGVLFNITFIVVEIDMTPTHSSFSRPFLMNVNNFVFPFHLSIILLPICTHFEPIKHGKQKREKRDEGNFVSEPKNVANSTWKKNSKKMPRLIFQQNDRFFQFKVAGCVVHTRNSQEHSFILL